MRRDAIKFVRKCHGCQVQANLIHTHPQSLQNMVISWSFHTGEIGLVGLVNPPSNGYIWIIVVIEYFIKWAEAIPLRKATRGAVANFIKENIIVRFGVPHRIISDNCTLFVIKEDAGILPSEALLIIVLLPSGEWVGRSNKQNPH